MKPKNESRKRKKILKIMKEKYIKIHNVNRRSIILERWSKTKRFVLRDTGRWGPKWLHRVVLRMATNLGMLSHEIGYHRTETIQTKEINTRCREIGGKIFRLAKPFLDDGYKTNELMVLCGPDFFGNILADRAVTFNYTHDVLIGHHDRPTQLYGFNVAVIEHLEGAIVIPKNNLRKAI
jgi:hypothetical protein